MSVIIATLNTIMQSCKHDYPLVQTARCAFVTRTRFLLLKYFAQFKFQFLFVLFSFAAFVKILFPCLSPVVLIREKNLSITEYFLLNKGNSVLEHVFLQPTLPDDDDRPALGLQLAPDLLVAFLIAGYFSCPKLRISFGNRE